MRKRDFDRLTKAQQEEHRERERIRRAHGYRHTPKPAPITLPKVSILELRDWEIEYG